MDGELDVHQTFDLKLTCQLTCLPLDLFDHWARQAVRGNDTSGIARVDAGFFDVLHHAADQSPRAVAQAIDVHFNGGFEELVDQDGLVRRGFESLKHIAAEGFLVVDDFHGPAAENIAGADEHGIADSSGRVDRLRQIEGDAVGRLFQLQAIHQALEALAILGQVDAVNAGPNDGSAGRFQRLRQIERRLAAELHDQSFRLHPVADIEHVLGGQRFEE